MELQGHIRNGVVVFEGNPTLPDGAVVLVSIPAVPPGPPTVQRRVEFPLVRDGLPGTWNLTNEMIAEIFEEEDIEMMKGMWSVPS